MKPRIFAVTVLWFVVASVFALLVVQRRSISALSLEADHFRMKGAAPEEAEATSAIPMPDGAARGSLASQETLELMRLRSRVTDLRERQRALGKVALEHVELERQWKGLTNVVVSGSRPVVLVFWRTDAQPLGAATPEAVVSTLLWSVEHQDLNGLQNLATPELKERLTAEIERLGVEAFFAKGRAVSGIRILGRNETGPDEMELQVEWITDDPPASPMKLRRIEGEWRIDSM